MFRFKCKALIQAYHIVFLAVCLLLCMAAFALACTTRSTTVRRHFMKMTGYPHGRAGYVIDHIVPLCKGGPDAVGNMQWQSRADAAAKDKVECRK